MQSEACSLEERQLALRKALESHTFARSEQLKAFLRYICEAEMLRPSANLTEYVIGVEVLGRPEGYSPAEDSSVRTRAYELRQKLERLYTRELPDEPVQIVVPKGTYSPHFVHHITVPPEVAPVAQAQAALPQSHSRFGLMTLALVLIASLLASAVTWRLAHATPTAAAPKLELDPVLAEAWGPLADHTGTVLLCLATPLTMVAGPFDHDVFGSKDYPLPEEAYTVFRQHRPLSPDQKLGLTLTDNMIAVGTMNAALIASKTLRNFGTSYQLLPERVATISALRGRNFILFGAPVDSEAVSREMADQPLTIDYEPSIHEFVVRDRVAGKFTAPKKAPNGDFTEVFGLITVKTSKDTDRRSIQSVVFSGITSVGVNGAAEYFSSASAMSNLKSLLAKETGNNPNAGFPASYQVVVRCTNTNLLLLSADYYDHRVVRPSL